MIRQVYTFELTCDGYYPEGGPHSGEACLCDFVCEAYSSEDFLENAGSYGWYQDHRGWICNARGGHDGDA